MCYIKEFNCLYEKEYECFKILPCVYGSSLLLEENKWHIKNVSNGKIVFTGKAEAVLKKTKELGLKEVF